MEAYWEIEGEEMGIPYKVNFQAKDSGNNNQGQHGSIKDDLQTVPFTRGIYEGMEPTAEIKVKVIERIGTL